MEDCMVFLSSHKQKNTTQHNMNIEALRAQVVALREKAKNSNPKPGFEFRAAMEAALDKEEQTKRHIDVLGDAKKIASPGAAEMLDREIQTLETTLTVVRNEIATLEEGVALEEELETLQAQEAAKSGARPATSTASLNA